MTQLKSQRHTFLPPPYKSCVSGIYAIVNRNSGKLYVGSAVHFHDRWREHRHHLAKSKHHSRYLQRAFDKEPEGFYIEIVEEIQNADKNTLLEREQFWINFFKSYLPQNGYNISPTAKSCQGVIRSPEFRRKMSEAGKKPWSEERKTAWVEIRKRTQPRGWKWSEEAKKRHSIIHTGFKRSKESCLKTALANRGTKHPQMGRPVSQCSDDGTLIKQFQAIAYAAKELGVKECNIRAALKNPHWHCGGFRWRDA
jgi:group I intron endonuclease